MNINLRGCKMGLDVYLYKADKFPTEDDMNEEKNGVFSEEGVEIPSAKYPKHYFKIGYFRSSYNENGINTVLGTLINMDLYDIFEKEKDDYVVVPNWVSVLHKTNEAIKKYTEHLNSPVGKYAITTIYGFNRGGAKSKDDAFDIFKKQFEAHAKNAPTSFDSYSCNDGTFYLGEPLKVVGVIKGRGTGIHSDEDYIIFEKDEKIIEDDFYLQALEIVKETIEYVLAQKDDKKYYLHWSG